MELKTPVVSVEWLNENLNDKNLIVLDGTIGKTFDTGQKQILNARFFDIKTKFSDTSNPFPSVFPSKEQFQKEAQALGINKDSALVVYDDKGIYSSGRVWWMFRAFGFENIAVLNGGFPAWLKANYATENMKPYNGEKGNFTANLQLNFMMFFDEVKQASEKRTHTIIDARSANRFKCLEPEPRVGLRMGTIPNSVNLPYTDLMENGELKPKEALDKIFSKIIKEKPVVFSCGSGITACVLGLGAHMAGYKNIAIYDGSWTEWGSLVKE